MRSVKNYRTYTSPMTFDEKVAAFATQFPSLRGSKLVHFKTHNLPIELLQALAVPESQVPGLRSAATIAAFGLLNTPIFEVSSESSYLAYTNQVDKLTLNAHKSPEGMTEEASHFFSWIGSSGTRLAFHGIVVAPIAHSNPATYIHEGFHAGLALLRSHAWNHENLFSTLTTDGLHSLAEHGELREKYYSLQTQLDRQLPNVAKLGFQPLEYSEYLNDGEEMAANVFTGTLLDTLIQIGAIQTNQRNRELFAQASGVLSTVMGRSLKVDMTNKLFDGIENPAIAGALTAWTVQNPKMSKVLGDIADSLVEEEFQTVLPQKTDPTARFNPKKIVEALTRQIMIRAKK
ncbi:MAG: hypothetical protein KDD22_07445 [Bdellovibrionales bacterium]|nr:hypothetical protein [Bdellovibrionales bacterium]